MTAKKAQVVEAQVDESPVLPASAHTVDGGDLRKKSSFGRTFYYLDLKRIKDEGLALDKGPGQLRGLIKWMKDKGVTSPEKALQGSEIGRRAKEDGWVISEKLQGEVIFAYYVRRMERDYGVEHKETLHAKTGKKMY